MYVWICPGETEAAARRKAGTSAIGGEFAPNTECRNLAELSYVAMIFRVFCTPKKRGAAARLKFRPGQRRAIMPDDELARGEGTMTRRAIKIAWVGVGLCLAIGAVASVLTFVGPPDQPWHRGLRELSTLMDVAALLFWIAVFAIYWARKRRNG
ncbi:hypothetical protein [Hyphomicrobium sp.]|uniref:hypothetical protein n=1 Tax=Hyphomicrobium sp. TaxID=82 RepID=UPI003F7038AD